MESPPPLLLCHVCSVCGRMRSNGFHRHHPVIPGHQVTPTACRRCKKKAKKAKEKKSKEEEDGPNATIRIEIDGERRGRLRAREVYEVYRSRSSPTPPRVIYRSSSRVRVGLKDTKGIDYRVVREPSPERSPPPALRRRTRTEVRFSSPSPPRRGTQFHYSRDQVYEQPIRSPSPDSRTRLAAHPAPFRTVVTEQRTRSCRPERPASPAPLRGILKDSRPAYEQRSRHEMEDSFDSMTPEVGGNRVQFGRGPKVADREGNHARRSSEDDYMYYRHRHQRWERSDPPPPAPEPPVERLERVCIRTPSPPPRGYEEVRMRHVSPDHPRRLEEFRYRRSTPPPAEERERGRSHRPCEVSPVRKSFRSVSPNTAKATLRVQRTVSRSPPPTCKSKQEDWEDATDSDSEGSGEVEIRRWKGYDENGKPVTFVEERRRELL